MIHDLADKSQSAALPAALPCATYQQTCVSAVACGRLASWPFSAKSYRRSFIALLTFLLCTQGVFSYAAKEASEVVPDNAWIAQLKDSAHRVDVGWTLRLEKDPRKIPDLVKLLSVDDTDLKVTTLEILAETGDTGLWKTVVPLLKDKDPVVREAAAYALGSLGDRGALPFLVAALKEGMGLGESVSYWVMPSDITQNYRYACVEAINRLAEQ